MRPTCFTSCIVLICGALLAGPLFAQTPSPGPLYPIVSGGRVGLIDTDGRVVIPPRFEVLGVYCGHTGPLCRNIAGAEPIRTNLFSVRIQGRMAVGTRDGRVLGLVDLDGKPIGATDLERIGIFHDGVAPARKGGQWGLIDAEGQVIAPFAWEDVHDLLGSGYLVVAKGGLMGMADRHGRIVVPIEYRIAEDGLALAAISPPMPLSLVNRPDGGALLRADGTVVRCDLKNYDSAYGLLDLQGKWIRQPEKGVQINLWQVSSNGVMLIERDTGGYQRGGLIDETGRIIVPIGKYWDVAVAEGDRFFYEATREGRMRILDDRGNEVTDPVYSFLIWCDEGLCVAGDLKGKCGHVDLDGHWVIAAQYEQYERFSGPLATVRSPGSGGSVLTYINRSGKVVYRMDD